MTPRRTLSAALYAAYCQTTYRVHLPDGPYDLKVGATHPAFDAALDALGVASWGFISAANPMSQAVDPHVNHAQHDALIQAAQRMGYPVFPGLGIPENDAWDSEPSLCVCNISAPALQKLGIQFRQNAAVWGAVRGAAQFVWCLGLPPHGGTS